MSLRSASDRHTDPDYHRYSNPHKGKPNSSPYRLPQSTIMPSMAAVLGGVLFLGDGGWWWRGLTDRRWSAPIVYTTRTNNILAVAGSSLC
jgi:hypothetical protein